MHALVFLSYFSIVEFHRTEAISTAMVRLYYTHTVWNVSKYQIWAFGPLKISSYFQLYVSSNDSASSCQLSQVKLCSTCISFFLNFQTKITVEPGKVDVIEVAEVTEQVKKLTTTTTELSTADVQFVATLLQDLATATSSTDDIVEERMVEQEVSFWSSTLSLERRNCPVTLRGMAIGFATWLSVPFLGTGTTSCHAVDLAWALQLQTTARFAGRQGVRFGKTAEAKFSQLQVDFDAQCV